MQKIKNIVTLACSCGNLKSWTITVEGGLNFDGTYKSHKYFIHCEKCDAKKLLAKGSLCRK
jgi:hypothetical protein